MPRQHSEEATPAPVPAPDPRAAALSTPALPAGPSDRAVAVASQADGLEHAVPLHAITVARAEGQWPLALCQAIVVPGALGTSGRDCRRCRALVLATSTTPRHQRQHGWWRRLLARLALHQHHRYDQHRHEQPCDHTSAGVVMCRRGGHRVVWDGDLADRSGAVIAGSRECGLSIRSRACLPSLLQRHAEVTARRPVSRRTLRAVKWRSRR